MMKRMMSAHGWLIGVCLWACTACHESNDKLAQALRLAGDNRPELERVLTHYAHSPADSLKLRAARFLIENMPGHYTLDGDLVNEARKQIDEDSLTDYFRKKALEVSLCYRNDVMFSSRKLEDVHYMTADYLIHHIDRSFERREQYPWLRDLPLDYFMEYVLPYRQASERLDNWIDVLQVDSSALAQLMLVDNEKFDIWNHENYLPVGNKAFVAKNRLEMQLFQRIVSFDCFHMTLHDNLRSKISAFPAAIDCIPYYANRNGSHYWNVSCSPVVRKVAMENSPTYKSAKVYRWMYSHQTDWRPAEGEYIPDFFCSPFYKDVTDEYFFTSDASVGCHYNRGERPNHAYLAVFCNLQWEPIAITADVDKKGNAVFKSMGRHVLYRPVYYEGRGMRALNYPFILKPDGKVKYLIPDTLSRQSIRIERKYPMSRALLEYAQSLQSLAFIGSNDRRLSPPDSTLAYGVFKGNRLEFQVDSSRSCRFFALASPRDVTCAEIVCFDNKGNVVQGNAAEQWRNAFDGNPLSNIDLLRNQQILIDFGRPVSISRVVLLPRSDGNGIYPGDDYELFYHDLHGWRSLGRRTAADYYLDYDNLPAGALYWLHNHTRGVEERPFTLTPRGEIRFW